MPPLVQAKTWGKINKFQYCSVHWCQGKNISDFPYLIELQNKNKADLGISFVNDEAAKQRWSKSRDIQ